MFRNQMVQLYHISYIIFVWKSNTDSYIPERNLFSIITIFLSSNRNSNSDKESTVVILFLHFLFKMHYHCYEFLISYLPWCPFILHTDWSLDYVKSFCVHKIQNLREKVFDINICFVLCPTSIKSVHCRRVEVIHAIWIQFLIAIRRS